MNRTISALGFTVLAVTLAVPAFAAPSPQTGNLNITATVSASCDVTSTTNIAFGAYDPADVNFTTPLDGTGSVTIRCVRGTVVDVALGQGLNAATGSSCASPLRRMSNGGTEHLGYEMYQNAARTTAWGCDTTNDQSFTATGPNSPTTLTTYGRIPAGQDVTAGSYTDTVVVTATF
jgi:spore coat protein U-like protein